jgi:hypothetical protein
MVDLQAEISKENIIRIQMECLNYWECLFKRSWKNVIIKKNFFDLFLFFI